MLCCFILIFPCTAIFRFFKENTVVQVYDLHGWMLCSCGAKPISVLVGLMPANDREWHYGIFSVRLAFHRRAFFTRPVTYIFENTKDGLSQLLLPEHICWKSYSNRASTWREIATSKSHDPAIKYQQRFILPPNLAKCCRQRKANSKRKSNKLPMLSRRDQKGPKTLCFCGGVSWVWSASKQSKLRWFWVSKR